MPKEAVDRVLLFQNSYIVSFFTSHPPSISSALSSCFSVGGEMGAVLCTPQASPAPFAIVCYHISCCLS